MNYGELRDSALKLINQYTIAGQKIPLVYNNQQDYLLRIPSLVNEAQVYIASGPRRIREMVQLDRNEAEYINHMYRFALPEDRMEIKPGGLFVMRDHHVDYVTEYICQGEDYILVPDWVKGDIYLEYYRQPKLLPMEPEDDAPLDNTLNAQMCLPYYVAAHLVLQDDAYIFSVLNNEWLQKVSMLEEPIHAHQGHVADVYNLSAWEGY